MKTFGKLSIVVLALTMLATSCNKEFLETAPTNQLGESDVFSSTENSLMAINGIHRYMHEGGSSGTTTSNYGKGGYPTFCLILAYMSDDLVWTYNNVMLQEMASWLNHRNLTHNYDSVNYYWKFYYTIINNANKALFYIYDIPGDNNYRYFVAGQAYAYRAFAHFQLVQNWANRYEPGGANTHEGVIIRTKPSYENLPRSTVAAVYDQINKDLDSALVNFGKVTNWAIKANKSHIDQWVAKGLQARVFLTQGRWEEAAAVAADIVDHSPYKLQDDTYTCGFNGNQMSDSNNTEWIWGQIHSDDATQHGALRAWHTFISNNSASYNRNTPRAIYNQLYKTIPDTDVRKNCWIENPYTRTKITCMSGTYDRTTNVVVPSGSARLAPWMSQKWLINDGEVQNTYFDVPYMRLPEMMLIAAEGYARANQATKAETYLLKLAQDRDPSYTIANGAVAKGEEASLINKIMWQRRIELWAESGIRFYDLKRLHLALDRGPKPANGYNQGGTTNGWSTSAKKMPENLDPNASNYNMYGEQGQREDARNIAADDVRWNWLVPSQELNINPLCTQNK